MRFACGITDARIQRHIQNNYHLLLFQWNNGLADVRCAISNVHCVSRCIHTYRLLHYGGEVRRYNYPYQRLLLYHFLTIICPKGSVLLFLVWFQKWIQTVKINQELACTILILADLILPSHLTKLNNSGKISCPCLRTLLKIRFAGHILNDGKITLLFE
jgi:hypothetical protein